jgi:hypothetical protein
MIPILEFDEILRNPPNISDTRNIRNRPRLCPRRAADVMRRPQSVLDIPDTVFNPVKITGVQVRLISSVIDVSSASVSNQIATVKHDFSPPFV